jgi:hypothetical protein
VNVAWHAATGVPFAAMGEWGAAALCVAPDLPWVVQEWRYRAWRRARGNVGEWHEWVVLPGALHRGALVAYRLTHSFLVPLALALASAPLPLIAGYTIHLLLDLPTHAGPLRMRPLYPLSNRAWPFVFRSIKEKFNGFDN